MLAIATPPRAARLRHQTPNLARALAHLDHPDPLAFLWLRIDTRERSSTTF